MLSFAHCDGCAMLTLPLHVVLPLYVVLLLLLLDCRYWDKMLGTYKNPKDVPVFHKGV
jgi:hypothetical protein